jgi:Xaa-Pro aminopeptidase
MSEIEQKLNRIQALLEQRKLDALMLSRVSSFAWATCGAASYVNAATSTGEAVLFITSTSKHLITNNIEETRLKKEEKLLEQGWEFHITPWYEKSEMVKRLAGESRLGADVAYHGAVDLSLELSQLRAELTPKEEERIRVVGNLCGKAMGCAAARIQPGQSEYQIAAILAQETQSYGLQPIVILVAVDERAFSYRHPLPTDKRLDRYAMLILCGRRWGLVCSITRLIHFGTISDELRWKTEAVARIDATLIDVTRPGVDIGGVLKRGIDAYAEAGFRDEWRYHHQGGLAGYEPREHLATPDSHYKVKLGQAYAWNPSISGIKSEDTILVGEEKNEILTKTDEFPSVSIVVNNQVYERPMIMEIT